MTGQLTDRAWLRDALADGEWHSQTDLLRRSQEERGHGLTVHSRASELRTIDGLTVEQRNARVDGRIVSSYRLVSPVEPQALPTSPDGGTSPCGSTDETPTLFQIPESVHRRGAYDEEAAA